MPDPAPVPLMADAGAAQPFDGDWNAFVESQGFSGMAGLLARYGVMESFEGNHLVLVLPEGQRMYAEKSYQDKLKAELAVRFGTGLRLSVRVGEAPGRSVAAVRSEESQRKRDGAAAALERDPFVRDLVEGMGAQVVPASIRPAGDVPDDNADRRSGK